MPIPTALKNLSVFFVCAVLLTSSLSVVALGATGDTREAKTQPSVAVSQPAVDAELGPKGQYGAGLDATAGGAITKSMDVTNTGEQRHTFYVGFGVTDPSGEAWNNGGTAGEAITLDPGETKRATVRWNVEPEAPEGPYDGAITVWSGDSSENLGEPLDTVRFPNWFTLDRADDGGESSGDGESSGSTVAAELGSTTAYPTDSRTTPDGATVFAKRIDVTNTGEQFRTYFIGLAVTGPSGATDDNYREGGTSVRVPPGETRTVTVQWIADVDASPGAYDGEITVWQGDSAADRGEQLDSVTIGDLFTLEGQSTVDAELGSKEQYGSGLDATAGGAITQSMDVTNTGNERHTFYVGFGVTDPSGEAWNNGGTAGQAVTLDPGETERVTVQWNVESDAPEGQYDGAITVWSGDSSANLGEPLDTVRYTDWFTLERSSNTGGDSGGEGGDGNSDTGADDDAGGDSDGGGDGESDTNPNGGGDDGPNPNDGDGGTDSNAGDGPTTDGEEGGAGPSDGSDESGGSEGGGQEGAGTATDTGNGEETDSNGGDSAASTTGGDEETTSNTDTDTGNGEATDSSANGEDTGSNTGGDEGGTEGASGESASSPDAGPGEPNAVTVGATIRAAGDDQQSGGDGDGFGVAVAVGAVLLLALWARRKR